MVAPYVYMNHYCEHHWSFISLYCLCHIQLIYMYAVCGLRMLHMYIVYSFGEAGVAIGRGLTIYKHSKDSPLL